MREVISQEHGPREESNVFSGYLITSYQLCSSKFMLRAHFRRETDKAFYKGVSLLQRNS